MSSTLADILSTKDPASWMAVGFGIMLTMYLMMRTRAKKRDPLASNVPRLSLAQQRGVEQQMQNLLVELNEMARQITAQLDTRATRLELLIQEANETIARLEQTRNRPSDAATNPINTAHEARASSDPPDARHTEIYTLSDQGISTPDIASRLSRPRGEVELILALRR